MVCCAIIAIGIAGILYVIRALVPGLTNHEHSKPLSWRLPAREESIHDE